MPKHKVIEKSFLDFSNDVNPCELAQSIISAFQNFEDYRRQGRTLYPAWFIILGAICGYLSGCNTIQEIVIYIELKQEWFAELLQTPIKAPSYNVFWTFFVITKPEEIKNILKKWFSGIPESLKNQLLIIDGKRLKGSSTCSKIVHVVELFASEDQLTLYQEKVPDKKSELAAIEPILAAVDVEGSLLSMDALFTQRDIATRIIENKADYLMGLKGNQSKLHEEVIYHFEGAHKINFEDVEHDFYEDENTEHGRREKRLIRVVSDLDEWLPLTEKWSGLKTAIEVISVRTINEKTESCTRYYISSKIASAKEFGKWIRGHWSIENNLHWVVDVIFREDETMNRVGNTAENLSLLRRVSMNIINVADPMTSISTARQFATHEPRYLRGILAKVFGSVKTF